MQFKSHKVSYSNDTVVQKWLQERQELMIALHQLCNFRPFNNNKGVPQLITAVQEFCQILLDYISLGHFGVFAKLIDVIESHHAPKSVPASLLGNLVQTTKTAVNFNDKYQSWPMSTLEDDLSHLVHTIARRFEWEDKLINLYCLAKMRTVRRFPTLKS